MYKITETVYYQSGKKFIRSLYIVTDQHNEVSCHGKNFIPCPLRFSFPARVIQRKINLLKKITSEIVFWVSRSCLQCSYYNIKTWIKLPSFVEMGILA